MEATTTMTKADKWEFLKQFERFVQSGCQEALFSQWFYERVAAMFGFETWYNRHGFYVAHFSTPERILKFQRHILSCTCLEERVKKLAYEQL